MNEIFKTIKIFILSSPEGYGTENMYEVIHSICMLFFLKKMFLSFIRFMK
jgi:hypothetical protein